MDESANDTIPNSALKLLYIPGSQRAGVCSILESSDQVRGMGLFWRVWLRGRIGVSDFVPSGVGGQTLGSVLHLSEREFSHECTSPSTYSRRIEV